MADLEITQIHNNPVGKDTESKLNDEYIVIKNASTKKYEIEHWIVSDRTPTGKETHIFRFPEQLGNGHAWSFDPGELIFLRTGKGVNNFIPKTDAYPAQFHFYLQREAFVWNNTGDTAYLRSPDGQFEHWKKVP